MSDAFVAGWQAGVSFQPAGGASTEVPVTGHNLDIMAQLFDVTQTSHNGGTARIAGKTDVSGTVNGALDADAMPHNAPLSIRPGTRGIILQKITPTKAVQVPVIVEKLHYEAAVGNEVRFSFDVKYNVLAGDLVYPAA
ncbi:MAG: hypothetical protein IT429_25695 [Gemmataceae bacterium]|nr:hypothetical protein [Gemmataceae bacterium]